MKTSKVRIALFSAAIGLLTLAGASYGAFFETAADIQAGHVYAEQFPQVGFITMVRSDRLYGGSAVLIAPNWIITAGHNLHNGGDPSDILEFRFRTGVDPFGPSGPDHFRLADEWYVHPGYSDINPWWGVDIALARLAEPINDIPPAPLLGDAPTIGMPFVGVGFGTPGSIETGMLPIDWKKRAGNNTVSSYAFGDNGYIRSEFSAPPNALPLEWMTTPGDSGGAWFVEFGGDLQLLAVNSFQLGDQGYGNYSGARQIYDQLDWIHGITGIPEPGTLGLLLVGSALLLRRRHSFR